MWGGNSGARDEEGWLGGHKRPSRHCTFGSPEIPQRFQMEGQNLAPARGLDYNHSHRVDMLSLLDPSSQTLMPETGRLKGEKRDRLRFLPPPGP